MNRKIVFALSSLLLLASCSASSISDEGRKEIVSKLNSYTKALDVSKYNVAPTGHIEQFDKYIESSTDYDIPSGEVSKYGKSYVFALPIYITKENFCKEDYSTDVGYAYSVLTEQLEFTSDPVTKMRYEFLDDGLIKFYTKAVSRTIYFYNFYAEGGPESEEIIAYGRFDISATYNSSGLLIKEECNSVDGSLVEVSCSYTYK